MLDVRGAAARRDVLQMDSVAAAGAGVYPLSIVRLT